MNKQELASKIWAGANELRGKVSASDYKDYMLGFIFYKFLSNKEEKYVKENLYFEEADMYQLTEEDTDTVENCRSNIGYFIANENLFSNWIAKGTDFQIKDVRTALSAFDRLIGTNYTKVYSGIFTTLQTGLDSFGTQDSERSKAIRKLITLINDIPVEGKQEYDVLGFVYEFLLKNFAANAGKAGEFYTPYQASVVMSEIIANHLKDRDEISIYDPTSGSGSLLLNIGKSVSKHFNDPNKIKYYAQELIPETYNLTRMNLVMRGILPDNIIVRNGDTLADDWPFFNENDKEMTYETVWVDAEASNPPYSQSWATDGADTDPRFSDYGVAPKSKADYAFLLHNLYHLKPDGIMTIVLPHGVLFRGGEEGEIRKNLVDRHHIETIIGLPANCFYGTGIPTIIMVLKKNRESNDILFVDASKGFAKEGNKNVLRDKDVRKIVDTVLERKKFVKKYSRLVSYDEIVKNEYNLNIPRYVDSSDKESIHDIYATMFGGIPNSEIDLFKDYWDAFPSLRNEIFTQEDIPYSHIAVDNLENIVKNNVDVEAFVNNFKEAFKTLPAWLKAELIDKASIVHINKEESILADKIKEMLSGLPLVDYYDAYQLLADDWDKIALDLETIQVEGFDCLTKVDPKYIYKKNKTSKEMDEIQDGWKGRILSFQLVQDMYFKHDKDNLENLVNNLSTYETEKSSLLEAIDPNDKAELVDDEGEIVTKKLNAAISKIKKELKKGAEFEEDSYEDIIIRVNATNEAIKKVKADIKTLKAKLETDTKAKIEGFTQEEAINTLVAKWITPLYNSINNLPDEVIEVLVEKINALVEKYSTTYEDVANNIKTASSIVCEMIDELTGNEFDTKGLKAFKKLIGGVNDGK